MSAASILVVEDDPSLSELLIGFLLQSGFAASCEARGDRAVQRILDEQPALVILDLTLPGQDGLEVCRQIRPRYRGPVLMLTARGDSADEIMGLELGADDYLAKPVRPRVLLARANALLRRISPAASGATQVLRSGPLVLEPASREARLGSTQLPLTSGEFDLLHLLVLNAGQVLSRAFIHERLCGAAYDEGLDRAIDLRMSRLRNKLRAIDGVERIKTVRGVGYLYAL